MDTTNNSYQGTSEAGHTREDLTPPTSVREPARPSREGTRPHFSRQRAVRSTARSKLRHSVRRRQQSDHDICISSSSDVSYVTRSTRSTRGSLRNHHQRRHRRRHRSSSSEGSSHLRNGRGRRRRHSSENIANSERKRMSVGLQRRVPALDEAGGGVPAAWKSSEPPFPSFAPPAGSPAGPAFAASPAPSTPGPGPGFAGPYAAAGPFGSPSARPGSGGGFPPGPQQGHFPGPGFAPPGSPFHPHPPHPPMPPHPHMMAPLPPPVDRRHAPYFGQPDYRVYELNKRLQQRTEESDNLWWDAFATEFFEDDATLTLTFCLEDGPKRYTIGRTLIPRYFRSIYEGGVSELYYTMRQPKESFHNTSITLDCDHCTMVTHHGKPMFTKVCTEGRLILEFTFDDLMRIKSWHMAVRAHRELIPRQAVHPPDHAALDQLAKNITRQGITNSTLNYLRLCVILEPMQELMSRHKAYALSPRDCLKTTLFQKWQRMVAPPESQRPASKRRKRKGSAGANAAPPAPAKKRSPGPNFSLASQDVMVVGEPSLMGGEFGDEDERLITRLENTQYEGDAVEWSAPPASPAKTPPTH